MKNKLSKFYFLALATFLSCPVYFAQAQIVPGGDAPMTYKDLMTLFDNIVQFIALKLAGPIAVLVILVAGIMLVFVPIKPGTENAAKKALWGAVWGLVVTLSAYIIVKLVVSAFVPTGSGLLNVFN